MAASMHPVAEGGTLSIGGVLSETFRLFGKAPASFLLLGAVSQIADVVQLLTPESMATSPTADLVVHVVDLLVLALIQTAIIHLAVCAAEGRPAQLGEALLLGLRRYVAMVGTTFLTFLVVAVGFALLIMPGVILGAKYAVAVPVCAIEGTRPIASMNRSSQLTQSARRGIIGAYIIFYVPMLVLIGVMAKFAVARDDRLFEWVFMAAQIFWAPLTAILSAAIYLALRRTNENAGVAEVFD